MNHSWSSGCAELSLLCIGQTGSRFVIVIVIVVGIGSPSRFGVGSHSKSTALFFRTHWPTRNSLSAAQVWQSHACKSQTQGKGFVGESIRANAGIELRKRSPKPFLENHAESGLWSCLACQSDSTGPSFGLIKGRAEGKPKRHVHMKACYHDLAWRSVSVMWRGVAWCRVGKAAREHRQGFCLSHACWQSRQEDKSSASRLSS